jgi:hypothetical protein
MTSIVENAAACPVKGHVKSLQEYRGDRTDGPSKCSWFPGTHEKSPHQHYRKVKPAILSTILDHVGGTPMVKINRLAEEAGLTEAGVELVAKRECRRGPRHTAGG